MEERSGVALGPRSHERVGGRSNGISLDEWGHEVHDGDDVASLDAPAEDRFGDAVFTFHRQLARFAYLLSGSREVAEGSVAETYARLWPTFRRGGVRDVLPQLIRTVIVEVEERTSKVRRRRASSAPQLFETPWAALLHIPLEQRSALVLHVVEGLDLDDTARLLGDPVEVTEARIAAGMSRISELVAAGGSHA